jgi:hypothetical protein
MILYDENANSWQQVSFSFVFEVPESYSQHLLFRMPVIYIYLLCDDHVQISLVGTRADRISHMATIEFVKLVSVNPSV